MKHSKLRRIPTIVVWIPAINPYWAARLSGLARRGDINLICWFTNHRGEGRDWVVSETDLGFTHAFLPTSLVKRLSYVIANMIRIRPTHILTFHFAPLYWLVLPSRLFGCHTAFYVEKTFESWVKRTRVKEVLKRILFRSVRTIFVPGMDAKRYVQRYAPRAEFRLLQHAVDVDRLSHAGQMREPSATTRFLYLGRLVPEKGISTMLRAFDLAALTGADISLHIVGSGPMQSEIHDWCSKTNSRASMSGFIQSDQLPEVFAGSDVLIFPTRGDPYGLVVNESLAAGLAVISSCAAGEIAERLILGPDPARGVLYPQDDVMALREAILKLSSAPKMVADMAQSGQKFAADRFALSLWVGSMITWLMEQPGEVIMAP